MAGLDRAQAVKAAAELGADLCGIAVAGAFAGAPRGFGPCDALPSCRSVVVVAKRFLASTMSAASTIPYTIVRNELTAQMDTLTTLLAYRFEAQGIEAVPTGAIGPCERDTESGRWRGLISLKHAAELAGMGRIGKNTLLLNERFGNMIWLGAVLTSAELVADPPAAYTTCPQDCSACIDACPVGALDGDPMDQRKCWDHAFGERDGGEWRISCFRCRKVCPQRQGVE